MKYKELDKKSKNKLFKQKIKYSILLLVVVLLLSIILAYGELKGFYGKKAIIIVIIILASFLYFIWKDELNIKGFKFGFRRSTMFNSNSQYSARKSNGSEIKDASRNQTPKQIFSADRILNTATAQKNSANEISQMNYSYLQQRQSSGKIDNQNIFNRIPNENQPQMFGQDRGLDMRLDGFQPQQNQMQNNNRDIQRQSFGNLTSIRKWGKKQQQQTDDTNQLGANSQNKYLPFQNGQNNQRKNQSLPNIINTINPSSSPQQAKWDSFEKTTIDRNTYFENTLKKISRDIQTHDQLTNAIQKSKIYSFHIIKERSSAQLKNILEMNKLLFEQFNLILSEAEIAQNMIQELENRYDLLNSDKRRVNIDDLHNFKNTFQKQKHSIWYLPYDHQTNLEIIAQLIDMIETREQLDQALEVKGYSFFEIRTHVLTRLFYMYNQQDCEDDQRKQIPNKFPTDIEIVAHCLFLNINEICQQQKDLMPCRIEHFEVQNEKTRIPITEQTQDKFYMLICNKINFEPYFMLQVGNEVLHSIQGPFSFFCVLILYFLHLKNNIFHTLSYSECKEILEAPAKYILNYENEYRKGFDRYYN